MAFNIYGIYQRGTLINLKVNFQLINENLRSFFF